MTNKQTKPEAKSYDSFIEKNKLLPAKVIYSELLNISEATFWRMVSSHSFPEGVKITGKRIGWPVDEVEAWLEQRKSERKH